MRALLPGAGSDSPELAQGLAEGAAHACRLIDSGLGRLVRRFYRRAAALEAGAAVAAQVGINAALGCDAALEVQGTGGAEMISEAIGGQFLLSMVQRGLVVGLQTRMRSRPQAAARASMEAAC